MERELIIRGRRITKDDLVFIQDIINKHWDRGRTFISKELCILWNWKQSNGYIKRMACSELLLRLEQKGLVRLPPRKIGYKCGKRRKKPIQLPLHNKSLITGSVCEYSPFIFKMVRGTEWDIFYKGFIDAYHYLGYCQTVGAHLKYMVFYRDCPVACLAWGAAAWKVECRDAAIGWSAKQRDKNRHLIVQNTRFLILPWIHIPHLASHILGQMAKIVPRDWRKIYNQSIILFETFVDTERFKGTCYKAANWKYLGTTKGRGKWDRYKQAPTSIKAVYIYPLVKKYKELLISND